MTRPQRPPQVMDPDTAILEYDAPPADRGSSSRARGAFHAEPTLSPPTRARSARPDERGSRTRRADIDTPQGASSSAGGWAWIDRMSLRSLSQVLVPVMVVALVIASLSMWLDARRADDAATLSRLAADALMHSQRAARAAQGAAAGQEEAARQLRESVLGLDAAMNALVAARDPDSGRELMVAGPLNELVAAAQTPWKVLSASASTLLERQAQLRALAAARRALADGGRLLQEPLQQFIVARLQAGVGLRELAQVTDLSLTMQRLAAHLVLLSAGPADSGAAVTLRADSGRMPELLDSLASGDARLRMPPVSDAEGRRILAEIRRLWSAASGPIALVMEDPDRLLQARRAAITLADQGEPLHRALGAVQDQARSGDHPAGRPPFLVIASLLTALLCALAIARAWLIENRRRADEAEQQRRVAERLEQQAKRTNDQNQAAILRLMNELQEVADGDLTVQATVSEDITGAIADSVNYTVEELRNLVSRINATAEMVNEASGKAQMTASSLQAASDQQSREIRGTGEAVLRMAQQIHEVSARASESVDVARQSLGASQAGARAVHNAIAGMNGIRDQIQETAKRIKRLGESSQQIGEIVELISDITEQTNVLALNAAIQAASAGEAGRGFTVVAEEVQRLAERSAEATKQIATLIRAIQADTQDAVAAMERSTQGVVEGTRLSDEAGSALDEIGRVSTQLADLIEDFSTATSKQAASAGTVAQSIQRILLVTEQTSEGTLQTAGSIRQLSELAQELKRSVSRFKVS